MALQLKAHVSAISEHIKPDSGDVYYDMRLTVDEDTDNMCDPGREKYCQLALSIQVDHLSELNVGQECTVVITPVP